MAEHDDVPASVRAEVIERDGSSCRICGRYVQTPGLHHIMFRSQGGRRTPSGLHMPDNLVVVGWLPGHDCHLTRAHGPRAMTFRAALTAVVEQPGVTALQLIRWAEKRRT